MENPNGTDTLLTITTLRAVREYTDRPVPDKTLRLILQAGRATGSSANRQPWTFHAVRNRPVLDSLAEKVWEPDNIRGCQVAIAIVLSNRQALDAGRAAQNMMLAAWALGVGSCPNTLRDRDAAREILGVDDDALVPVILSLGFPLRPYRPKDRDIDAILDRIKRKPLDEITRFID